MDRPARVQISKDDLDKLAEERNLDLQSAQGPNAVLNTWYRKWSGGSSIRQEIRRPFRCNLERDSGYTQSRSPYICLWFARGACYKGEECSYLHRAPKASDIMQFDETTDCFGRAKFADNREDMGGVGSFLNPNRTLFVGYFKTKNKNLQSLVEKHFSEWGEVVQVRLGKQNSVAFVTYKLQMSAEFAKEAMSSQTVTGDETLSVRWSHSKSNGPSHASDIDEDRIRSIVRKVLDQRHPKKARGPEDSDDSGVPSGPATKRQALQD